MQTKILAIGTRNHRYRDYLKYEIWGVTPSTFQLLSINKWYNYSESKQGDCMIVLIIAVPTIVVGVMFDIIAYYFKKDY